MVDMVGYRNHPGIPFTAALLASSEGMSSPSLKIECVCKSIMVDNPFEDCIFDSAARNLLSADSFSRFKNQGQSKKH